MLTLNQLGEAASSTTEVSAAKFSMKISIVIATNRDPNMFAKKTIDNILGLPLPHELEFIIACPFEIKIYNSIWVKDNGDGPVDGFNTGFQRATGDVIQLMADDVIMASKTWWNLAERVIHEKAIGTLSCRSVGTYLSPHFPMVSKNFLTNELNNYIFNPAYYYMQADNDLGIYCKHANIPIIAGHGIGHHTLSPNAHPKISFYSKMDAGIINLLWGEQAKQSPNEAYTTEELRILGERIRHSASINRMHKIFCR